jgi:ATP-dependent Clp protease ATP-binding subunit ClpA
MTPPPSLQDLIETVRQDARTDNALDQLVTAAAAVAQLEDTSDALLGHFVDRCRREGRSWSEISAALGVTKQAVHKRFAAVADQIIAAVPAPTMERFTGRARHAVAAARRLATGLGSDQVGSEHLLLALFEDPGGLAAQALAAMSVRADDVRAAVEALGKPETTAAQAATAGEDARFSPDGRLVLRDALVVALELGHNYIGTEHLLLGLYRNPGSPAAVILASAGATEDQAREAITEMLRGFTKPVGP